MLEFITDEEKNVYGLEKIVLGQKLFLNWNSFGHTEFLLLFGENEHEVDLNKNMEFREMLEKNWQQLVNEKNCFIKRPRVQCSLFLYSDLKRNGGFQIKDNPGVYAVYGVNTVDGQGSIYIAGESVQPANMFTMTIDITIETTPYQVKKGFLGRMQVYSGYQRISLNKVFPGMEGKALHYYINDYRYSFPNEIIQRGGAFFVKAPENAVIRFESGNPGITIK